MCDGKGELKKNDNFTLRIKVEFPGGLSGLGEGVEWVGLLNTHVHTNREARTNQLSITEVFWAAHKKCYPGLNTSLVAAHRVAMCRSE